MVDMGAITGMAASLRAAAEITTAMIGLRDAAKLQGKVIELQQVILAAQSSGLAAQSDQFALMEQVRELEAEKAKLQAWETEKQRYALKDFGGHTFAWELKPEAANGEPIHLLCPTCFEQGRKSILQFEFRAYGQNKYMCVPCETTFTLGVRQPHTSHSSGSSIL
jgi:hypothetical protein